MSAEEDNSASESYTRNPNLVDEIYSDDEGGSDFLLEECPGVKWVVLLKTDEDDTDDTVEEPQGLPEPPAEDTTSTTTPSRPKTPGKSLLRMDSHYPDVDISPESSDVEVEPVVKPRRKKMLARSTRLKQQQKRNLSEEANLADGVGGEMEALSDHHPSKLKFHQSLVTMFIHPDGTTSEKDRDPDEGKSTRQLYREHMRRRMRAKGRIFRIDEEEGDASTSGGGGGGGGGGRGGRRRAPLDGNKVQAFASGTFNIPLSQLEKSDAKPGKPTEKSGAPQPDAPPTAQKPSSGGGDKHDSETRRTRMAQFRKHGIGSDGGLAVRTEGVGESPETRLRTVSTNVGSAIVDVTASEQLPDHIARFHVTKINNIVRNSKRMLEVDTLTLKIVLYKPMKMKDYIKELQKRKKQQEKNDKSPTNKDGSRSSLSIPGTHRALSENLDEVWRRQYVIDPSTLVEATPSQGNNTKLKICFFASKQRLLRSQTVWRCRFRTSFERDRFQQMLRGFLEDDSKIGKSAGKSPARSGGRERKSRSTTSLRRASLIAAWNQYRPNPIKPSKEVLSQMRRELPVDRLAGELHEVWRQARQSSGWKYGEKVDAVEKTHPLMRPYKELTDEDMEYNMAITSLILGSIHELDYRISKGEKNSGGMGIQLSNLVEFLAENVHESWAQGRYEKGWKYGPIISEPAKLHPNLLPYAHMPESERDLDREAVYTILSRLVKWGYTVKKVRKQRTAVVAADLDVDYHRVWRAAVGR